MSTTNDRRLVGRDDELRSLFRHLDAVDSGGRAVGLFGEPGVGKSALQAEVVEHARSAGFTVLTARGSQSETHLPFASLHQLLRPLLSRVDRLPAPQRNALLVSFAMSDSIDVQPFFTALAVLELLVDAAGDSPVLVCLDDLHWMDQPSTDVLGFVCRRIAGERVVVLCTSRPEALPFADPHTIEWTALDGIDDAASAELLDARAPHLPAAVRERVLRQARGNPLALVEFAGALEPGRYAWTEFDEDLPMTTRLERAFATRAEHLDPAVRAVLTVAAVDDGDDLDDVLAAAGILHGSPVDLDTAQPAFEHGLLTVTGERYRIAHPLVGSALRQGMTAAARREAHAALARVLTGHPDRAVWHRASSVSGRDERIAAELEQAAGNAQRRGAVVSAAAWLERAAALSPDPQSQAARLLGAAELGFQLGRFSHVEQIKAQVAGMTLRHRDRSRLAWLEGVFHDGSTGEPAEVRHLVGLAEHATGEQDVDLAMQLLVGAARRVWWRDPGPTVRHEIVRAAGQVNLPAHDPRLLALHALCGFHERTPMVIEQLARWPADADGQPELAGLLGIAAFCTGDFRHAVGFLSTPVQELRAQGRMSLLAEALAIRAWAEVYLGVFDPARSADEAVRLADETGQSLWAATARIAVALIDAVREGWDTRHALLSEAEHVALRTPIAASSLLAGVQLARGTAELGANRHEQAYGELHRVFDPADPAFQRMQQVWALGYLADAAVRTDRRAEARTALASIEQLVGDSPPTGAAIALEYARAVLADRASAEPLFRAAMDGAASQLPWHRARIDLAYGSWLRRQRRVLESRGPLRAARSAFDAVGARTWANLADQELRATGERGWQPTSNPRELLSPQETHIAELAAQGLSNREIGQRLFLSHRTVSSHLYRIFPKLGVASRGQLAAVLTHHGDQPSPRPPSAG
ncbi:MULTISPECIES: LuxR family transcriptional regulator [unclassified Streptomyces]|uniref:ATP-binding protein n=1 Tax=unclassified Streptomyces TaxID=2593676 RepID=UPI00037496B4|nr:LuxR family transcriptional regulator [Streptomyces sp. BoleA5]MYX37049.1 AAA family ATPase [Streptomyces sp. SID8377]